MAPIALATACGTMPPTSATTCAPSASRRVPLRLKYTVVFHHVLVTYGCAEVGEAVLGAVVIVWTIVAPRAVSAVGSGVESGQVAHGAAGAPTVRATPGPTSCASWTGPAGPGTGVPRSPNA